MSDFYARDLAEIHAEGFGALGAAAAQVVHEALGDRINGARVVDIGCGAGALSAPLSEAGAEVWGLDLSPDLLDIARRQAPGAVFRQGSLHEVDLPQADVVCAIGEVVNYLADPRAGETGLADFLHRASGALPQGGLLLFDAAAPGRGASRSFTEGPGWAVGAVSEEAGGILTRRITTFRETGGTWRRSQELHRLALLAPDRVLAALDAAGFKAETLPGYGALTLPPGLPAYRATRL
ncbi:class I SAM-dependent methyltransferase [Phenylobacterium parvum]|uniref:Class I SAM-dependent methyltransferase n=1 Tax=Phenylobacterium parvum TaxID=2201350 RepID=A0A2Z3I2P2_9CAUL|nr:class I SAM-dependent methyltransferase [Phenylobacterium parvum]AWM77714.1 class I SAM-dependent methyltransferase [Phenylobacterium parvum]